MFSNSQPQVANDQELFLLKEFLAFSGDLAAMRRLAPESKSRITSISFNDRGEKTEEIINPSEQMVELIDKAKTYEELLEITRRMDLTASFGLLGAVGIKAACYTLGFLNQEANFTYYALNFRNKCEEIAQKNDLQNTLPREKRIAPGQ